MSLFQHVSVQKNMKKELLVLASLAMSVPSFAAQTIGDITYEDQLNKEKTTLKLNGAGLREILFVDVYAAGLYLPQKAATTEEVISMNGNKTVRLGLLRDVDAADFVDALNEGILDNTTEDERQALSTELQALITVMNKIGDVKKGDIVDFDYSQTHETSVTVNGKLIGEKIGGEALYRTVLKIWLGEKAIDSDLKKSLLKN